MKRVPSTAKRAKGLIRSLNRSAVRDDKGPQVVRKTAKLHEPTVCSGCGAVFIRKTWRSDHKLTHEMLAQAEWRRCPACEQVGRQEGQGRIVASGTGVSAQRDLIRRRIENVAARAKLSQPERRLVSIDSRGDGIEVLTTSQKLAHRIVHELKKVLGGKTSYAWNDDGTLFATWQYNIAKTGKKSLRA
jgi:NMD protein affecting ribosome stability and mRNA decay